CVSSRYRFQNYNLTEDRSKTILLKPSAAESFKPMSYLNRAGFSDLRFSISNCSPKGFGSRPVLDAYSASKTCLSGEIKNRSGGKIS
ncbi:hypothetical protein L9F63_003257, partial [Diploptera punctata]